MSATPHPIAVALASERHRFRRRQGWCRQEPLSPSTLHRTGEVGASRSAYRRDIDGPTFDQCSLKTQLTTRRREYHSGRESTFLQILSMAGLHDAETKPDQLARADAATGASSSSFPRSRDGIYLDSSDRPGGGLPGTVDVALTSSTLCRYPLRSFVHDPQLVAGRQSAARVAIVHKNSTSPTLGINRELE